jgi:hypothetical protein
MQQYDDLRRPLGQPQVYSLRASPARVAAADGMLDVFTKAFEDDIDRDFIPPMLRDLHEKLKRRALASARFSGLWCWRRIAWWLAWIRARRKGKKAIAQRSLIFAQTTMSPTIGDILDLLDSCLQRR